MSTVASQITGVSIVCSAVCQGADQRKHQNSASLTFVRGTSGVCVRNLTHVGFTQCIMHAYVSCTIPSHYNDVIMGAIASQPTGVSIFAQPFVKAQIKENIKAQRHWPMWGEPPATDGFPHKGTVTRKMFPFDDVIMFFQTRSKMMTSCTVYTVYGSGILPIWPSLSVSWRVYTTSTSAVTLSTMSGLAIGWLGRLGLAGSTRYDDAITLVIMVTGISNYINICGT